MILYHVYLAISLQVHGVVFVVDAADSSRFDDCKQALHQTLGQSYLKGKPILVLANKQDLSGAATAAGATVSCACMCEVA